MKKTFFVFVSALILFVTGCSVQTTQTTNTNTSPGTSTPSVTSTEVKPPQALPVQETSPVTNMKITYKNDKYGFLIELPDTWKDYTVTELKNTSKEYPVVTSFDFNLNGEMLFGVTVYTKAEFAKINPDENPIVYNTKIAENALYVFTAIGSQDNSDLLYPRRQEVEEILKTFKVY